MNRDPLPPETGSPSVASLRASLLGPAHPSPRERAPVDDGPAPSAAAVLEASPNAIRLCETYDHERDGLVRRGRGQRLGVAALATAAMLAVAILCKQHRIAPEALLRVLLAAAATAVLGLALLAGFWVRDQRRLRRVQGDRLVRALRVRCSLTPGQVEAFIAQAGPAQRFGELYRTWRESTGRRGGAAA